MNIEDVYPEQSAFLKAADLGGGRHTVTITAVGSFKFDDDVKITVSLSRNGQPLGKDLVVNKTNSNIVAGAYGAQDIDSTWVGKEIVIFVGQTGMGPGIQVAVPTANGAEPLLGVQPTRTEQMRGRPAPESTF